MSYDGTLKFDTALDVSGFQSGVDSLSGLFEGALSEALAQAAGFSEVGTRASAELTNGIQGGGGAAVNAAAGVANSMMAGMGAAMDAYAPALYGRASAIAAGIVARLRAAFQVHSPSRVMVKLFSSVMEGMIQPMEEKSAALFDLADGIANGVNARLAGIPAMPPGQGGTAAAGTGTASMERLLRQINGTMQEVRDKEMRARVSGRDLVMLTENTKRGMGTQVSKGSYTYEL